MNQKSVGLTSRAAILALAFIMVASLGLLPLDGVAHAQTPPPLRAAVDPGGNSITLTWDAIEGAASYRLAKDAGEAPWNYTYIDVPVADGTSHTDSAVVAGEVYNYYVQSVAADGTMGGWVGPARIVMPGGVSAPATAPANLAAAADGLTAIDVSWDAVSGATHYDLWRWDHNAGSGAWISGLTASPHKDSNVTAGMQYSYLVRAGNTAGKGPNSAYVSLTLEAATEIPELMLTHTSREVVDLSWTQVAGATEYQLERMTDVEGGSAVDVGWTRLDLSPATSRSYTDDEATYVSGTDSTTYSYRVRAVIGTDGPGEWSEVKMAQIPATSTLPAAPANPRVTSTSLTSVTFEWNAVDTATGYQVQYKEGDGDYSDPINVSSSQTSYTRRNLTAKTKYTFQVRSVNVNGESSWSDEANGETAARATTGGSVSTPKNLRVASATKDKKVMLKVSWSQVTGASNYELLLWVDGDWRRVYPDHQGSDADDAADDTVAADTQLIGTDTELVGNGGTLAKTFDTTIPYLLADGTAEEATPLTIKADTDYIFVIRTLKREHGITGFSDWSDPMRGKANALKPNDPTDLKADVRGSSTIWLSWKAPADMDEGRKPVTSYTLLYRSPGGGSGTKTVSGTTYAHTGLRANTTYYYRVRANNSGGSSGLAPDQTKSPTEIAATTAPQDLDAPTGLKAVDATNMLATATDVDHDNDSATPAVDPPGIEVSWAKVTGASMYDVQRWDVATSKWVPLSGSPVTKTSIKDEYEDSSGAGGDGTGDENILAPGTLYHYIVRATKGDITSPWSAVVSGRTRATVYMPTLDLEPTGQTVVRLSWTGVAGATKYELEYVEGGATVAQFNDDRFARFTQELPASPSYFVHTGRKTGTRYSYRMRAVLAHTKSDWSYVAQVVTRPARPDLKVASDATVTTTFNLSWKPVSFDGNPLREATDYQIQRRQTSPTQASWSADITGGTFSCAAPATECTYADTGDSPTAGQKYFYRIRVNRGVGADTDVPAPYDHNGNDTADAVTPDVASYWRMSEEVTIPN